MGMRQAGEQAALSQEAISIGGSKTRGRREDFEGGGFGEKAVAAGIHGAGRSPGEAAGDFVIVQPGLQFRAGGWPPQRGSPLLLARLRGFQRRGEKAAGTPVGGEWRYSWRLG
jgi:hypothetical protein